MSMNLSFLFLMEGTCISTVDLFWIKDEPPIIFMLQDLYTTRDDQFADTIVAVTCLGNLYLLNVQVIGPSCSTLSNIGKGFHNCCFYPTHGQHGMDWIASYLPIFPIGSFCLVYCSTECLLV